MSATHRTLAAIVLLTGALAAQQPLVKPGQSANPEITQLHTEVQVLQKRLADMRTRLDRLEQDGKFRLSPITGAVTPR